jgi:hypothetical protein
MLKSNLFVNKELETLWKEVLFVYAQHLPHTAQERTWNILMSLPIDPNSKSGHSKHKPRVLYLQLLFLVIRE